MSERDGMSGSWGRESVPLSVAAVLGRAMVGGVGFDVACGVRVAEIPRPETLQGRRRPNGQPLPEAQQVAVRVLDGQFDHAVGRLLRPPFRCYPVLDPGPEGGDVVDVDV